MENSAILWLEGDYIWISSEKIVQNGIFKWVIVYQKIYHSYIRSYIAWSVLNLYDIYQLVFRDGEIHYLFSNFIFQTLSSSFLSLNSQFLAFLCIFTALPSYKLGSCIIFYIDSTNKTRVDFKLNIGRLFYKKMWKGAVKDLKNGRINFVYSNVNLKLWKSILLISRVPIWKEIRSVAKLGCLRFFQLLPKIPYSDLTGLRRINLE
jgi:hypothetical protein